MRFFAGKGVDKQCNILTTDRISLSFFAVKTIFMLSRRVYCVHGFSVGVMLHELLTPTQWLAIVAIMIASVGTTVSAKPRPLPSLP